MKDILVDGFLPPPIKFIQTNRGIVSTEYDDERGRFNSLYLRLSLQSQQPMIDFLQIPFDYYCPSIRDQLAKRICRHCGLYFASQSAVKRHVSVHNENMVSDINDDPVPPRRYPRRANRVPIHSKDFIFFDIPFTESND